MYASRWGLKAFQSNFAFSTPPVNLYPAAWWLILSCRSAACHIICEVAENEIKIRGFRIHVGCMYVLGLFTFLGTQPAREDVNQQRCFPANRKRDKRKNLPTLTHVPPRCAVASTTATFLPYNAALLYIPPQKISSKINIRNK